MGVNLRQKCKLMLWLHCRENWRKKAETQK